MQQIPGYAYGDVPRSPITDQDFELLKKAVMLGEEDFRYLRRACEVLKDQVEDILDLWYGWVGSNEHLVYYFSDRETGKPIEKYLLQVRKRFGQWILDTTCREYDRAWLDYQYEIGLRHHRTKKGRVDDVNTVPHIPFRYMVAFIYPITATIKSFLARKGDPPDVVEKMYNAWFKSIVLQIAIWSYPYVKEGDW
ncbi:MAG: protoglobin domain-containing protein [Sulfolobales archaeon]